MNLLAPATNDANFVWNEAMARHLLERAGFGLPPSAPARLAKMPLADAVETLVSYQRYPDPYPELKDLPEIEEPTAMRRLAQLSAVERQKILRERRRAEREAMVQLEMWWLERMRTTPRPLQEKMTLFWHGHFAASAEKVRSTRLLYELNQTMRQHAVAHFGQLVRAVGKSPAMLIYLDNRTSRKDHPNENWARELFELFTLGEGHYTERDIREAARAFTGWTCRGEKFVNAVRIHDDGQKTIFGRVGRFDGDAVIDLVLQQPACAEFICRKLWTFFAYENPEEEIVKGLSDTFRKSNYELAPVLRQLFCSRAFFSQKAVATQIKSPTQYVVALTGQLATPLPPPRLTALAMRAMGQELFHPPNVKGWEGGRSWMNTNTVFVRCSFARYLLTGEALMAGAVRRGGNTPPSRTADAILTENVSHPTGAMTAETTASDAVMPDDEAVRAFLLALTEPFPSSSAPRSRPALFDVDGFFRPYEDWDVNILVNTLARYFLALPLSVRQKQTIVEAVNDTLSEAPKAGRRVRDLANAQRTALLYLLLSTAEYQMC
ncbi:MAG: DUF1800 domain-containing protein [Candidatus Sumerlaeaceae bacterium]|jgi:uncharacterized protein (DUF1800 family)